MKDNGDIMVQSTRDKAGVAYNVPELRFSKGKIEQKKS